MCGKSTIHSVVCGVHVCVVVVLFAVSWDCAPVCGMKLCPSYLMHRASFRGEAQATLQFSSC